MPGYSVSDLGPIYRKKTHRLHCHSQLKDFRIHLNFILLLLVVDVADLAAQIVKPLEARPRRPFRVALVRSKGTDREE